MPTRDQTGMNYLAYTCRNFLGLCLTALLLSSSKAFGNTETQIPSACFNQDSSRPKTFCSRKFPFKLKIGCYSHGLEHLFHHKQAPVSSHSFESIRLSGVARPRTGFSSLLLTTDFSIPSKGSLLQ
ncbi:hypothetical protein V8E51_000231 [Hyaloscypha variabilis]